MSDRPVHLAMNAGPGGARRRGGALIVAMIVVFALASLVLVLGRSVRAEATASANQLAQRQAAAIARGAEQYVLALLAEGDAAAGSAADGAAFERVAVGQGHFWIVRPDYGDPALPAFGLVDEAAKINLNAASAAALARVPGMTPDLADAIVAWRDPSGADSASYLAGPVPYRAKSGPFETVEELLLLRGMTRPRLYGQGTDLPLGAAASAMVPLTAERADARGLFDLFTVWNVQRNADAEGNRRINLNSQQQRPQLRRLLRSRLGAERGNEVIARIPPGNMADIFDFAQRLGLEQSEFELLEDRLTSVNQRHVRGRINVNAAPREVLLALRGLESGEVETLLAARPDGGSGSVAWVMGALGPRAVGLGNQISGRGRQFSADIVAASGDGRAFRRVRIVVDAARSPVQIVYRRDLTDAGWPLDPAILEELRGGWH